MDDWKTVRVSDVAARSANAMATGPFGSSIGSRFFCSSGVPVIRGSNLSVDPAIRINDENLVYLSPEKAAEFSRSIVRNGDLIFTSWGTINQVGLIDESASFDEYVISNKQMKLTPNQSIASPEFLYYLFSGPEMQREILEGAIGSSIPGFNLTRLRSIEILLPPLEEQKQIAKALSDAERQETTLRLSIIKKQEIKKGMMQQLLTGRTRLPGFAGRWRTNTVGSFTRVTAGGTPPTSVPRYWGGSIPWMSSGELHQKRVSDVAGRITEDGLRESSAQLIPAGTVLIGLAGQGKTRGTVAISSVVLTTNQSIAGILPSPDHVPDFLYYNLDMRYDELRAMSTGEGGRGGLNLSIIRSVPVSMPNIPEQEAIATALRDVDDELDVLHARLAKTHDIKQGMMQQLLTGRTRLPIPETTA